MPLTVALSGLGLGLSLIVPIGAQNAFVLRQGLRRQHIWVVVAVCALSDIALIAVGVAGGGALFTRFPEWLVVAKWAGAAFLLTYAAIAARRALRPSASSAPEGEVTVPTGPGAVAVTALALTWLNPHVYLDTVVLLGSIATTHGEDSWMFGLGAMTGSVVWFTMLALAARLLSPLFAKPIAWRIVDGAIAVVMVVIAINLLIH
ncbi:MAG: LysE/ArgO family amino acid transporter [Naasia sp.]